MSKRFKLNIRELIEKQSTESQLISIRLPTQRVNEIDELAAEINKTRSELIEAFINAGVEELIEQLKERDDNLSISIEDNASDQKRFFLVNTNYNNQMGDHYMMLDNQEVAAFYSTWKEQIKKIAKGDIIFLYHSGNGICAMGEASGELIIREHDGKKDECYAMKLISFLCNFELLNAKKCKDITKSNMTFRKVLNPLTKTQGEALQDYILQSLSD